MLKPRMITISLDDGRHIEFMGRRTPVRVARRVRGTWRFRSCRDDAIRAGDYLDWHAQLLGVVDVADDEEETAEETCGT